MNWIEELQQLKGRGPGGSRGVTERVGGAEGQAGLGQEREEMSKKGGIYSSLESK